MSQTAIFYPVLAMVALTFVVQFQMYRRRVREVRSRGIKLREMATRREAAISLQDSAAADNYSNLFELPMLFYLVCVALFVTETVTLLQAALAWAFVVSRVGHSVIHLTYNHVYHRLMAFVLSTICVYSMWILFAVALGLNYLA